MMTTTNFADFGYRERKLAAELLTASIEQGFPENFIEEGVQIMFNTHSGYVFLTNEEFQVAMMNGNKLEEYYTLPYSGEEGFAEDLQELDFEELNQDDLDFLESVVGIEIEVD